MLYLSCRQMNFMQRRRVLSNYSMQRTTLRAAADAER